MSCILLVSRYDTIREIEAMDTIELLSGALSTMAEAARRLVKQ